MLVAIPSEAPGGLDAQVSDHFGRCAAFTLVDLSDGRIGPVTVLPNEGHEHGGCLEPVRMLKDQAVGALIVGGMGMRPLAGFQDVGIGVYRNPGATTVAEAAELMAAGKCEEFGPAETCGGGCGGHEHHHQHEDVERPAIEGVADVRDDRVVSIHFTLTDKQGELVESTQGEEPIRYLHGHGNLPPGLERGLTGLLAGSRTVVEVSAAEGYGEYDAARVLEVPRGRLPQNLKVGTVVSGEDEHGRLTDFVVVELTDTVARLDANHRLAGKDLVFDVSIVGVEAATEAELEHGHPH